MTIDQKLRDASTSVREARRQADFTLRVPRETSRGGRAVAFGMAAVAVLIVIGLPLLVLRGLGGTDHDGVSSGVTTIPVVSDESQTANSPPNTVPPPIAISDITYLVTSVVASSELPGYEAEYLIDGDLDRGWQDASLRGVGAEIVLTFDEPVAITYLLIYPENDESRFTRNYKIQGYEISTGQTTLMGRLSRTVEPQRIEWGGPETDRIMIRVLTTFPAEPFGEKPPFDELAIAELRVFGDVGDGVQAAETTTTSIDGNSEGNQLEFGGERISDEEYVGLFGPGLAASGTASRLFEATQDDGFVLGLVIVQEESPEGGSWYCLQEYVSMGGGVNEFGGSSCAFDPSQLLGFRAGGSGTCEEPVRGTFHAIGLSPGVESATLLFTDGSAMIVDARPAPSLGGVVFAAWNGDKQLRSVELDGGTGELAEYLASFVAVNNSTCAELRSPEGGG